MRHDQAAALPQVLVAAGVVEMPVGVQHEPDGARLNALDRLDDGGRQGRVLVVHHEDAVFAGAYADVAAAALQPPYTAGDVRGRDGELLAVLLGGGNARNAQTGQQHGRPEKRSGHGGSSS